MTVPSIEGNSHDGLSGRTPWIAGFVRWAWIVLPIVLLVAVAIHVWGSRLRAHALLAELQRRDMSYSFVPDDWFPAMWPNRLRSLDYAFGYKLNGIGYSWSPEPPALGSLKSLLDPLDPSVNFSFNGAIGKHITQTLSDELIDDLNSVGFRSVSFFSAELDDDDLLQLARLGSLKNLTLQQCQTDASALKRFRLSRPDVRVDETN